MMIKNTHSTTINQETDLHLKYLFKSYYWFNWLLGIVSPFVCLNHSSKIKLKTLYISLKSTTGLDATGALDEHAATT